LPAAAHAPLTIITNPSVIGSVNAGGCCASDDSLFADYDAHVLIVSHGGPIRTMLRYFTDELNTTIHGELDNNPLLF
jgi:hypothetical protein